MIVMSIDTAHAACSVCIYDSSSSKVLAHLSKTMRQGHAEHLSAMVQEGLNISDISLNQLDRLAVCSGPGTFTGVRIALAFVRGLALVLKIPVVAVTTFRALAEKAREHSPGNSLWVVQDARRGEVYFQGFGNDGAPQCEALVLSQDKATSMLADKQGFAVGSGVGLVALPKTLQRIDIDNFPDTFCIARLASQSEVPTGLPTPFYLRSPDAKAQKPILTHAPGAIDIQKIDGSFSEILSAIHVTCFEDAWSAKAMHAVLETPGAIAFVATATDEDQHIPCGFVLARRAADEMEVLTIAVLPNMRRRGVGAALLKTMTAYGKGLGVGRVFIDYADTNEAAANLYGKTGFVRTGVRSNYYRNKDGTSHDAITAVLNVSAE